MAHFKIPVYIIRYPDYVDCHHDVVERQFKGKNEFEVAIVKAENNSLNYINLWISFQKIVRLANELKEDVIIICKEDIQFSQCFTPDKLFKSIFMATEKGANILMGNISSFGQAIPLSKEPFWISSFEYSNFIVIFRPFYHQILDANVSSKESIDLKLSEMTSNKMVMYPFIATQKKIPQPTSIWKKNSSSENSGMYRTAESRLERLLQLHQFIIQYNLTLLACCVALMNREHVKNKISIYTGGEVQYPRGAEREGFTETYHKYNLYLLEEEILSII